MGTGSRMTVSFRFVSLRSCSTSVVGMLIEGECNYNQPTQHLGACAKDLFLLGPACSEGVTGSYAPLVGLGEKGLSSTSMEPIQPLYMSKKVISDQL